MALNNTYQCYEVPSSEQEFTAARTTIESFSWSHQPPVEPYSDEFPHDSKADIDVSMSSLVQEVEPQHCQWHNKPQAYPHEYLFQFEGWSALPHPDSVGGGSCSHTQLKTDESYSLLAPGQEMLVSNSDPIEHTQHWIFDYPSNTDSSVLPHEWEPGEPVHFRHEPSVKSELSIDTTILRLGTTSLASASPLSEEPTTTTTTATPSPIPPLASPKTLDGVKEEFENFLVCLRSKLPHLIFMPQRIYQSHAKADHERYVRDAKLQPPIQFLSKIDGCGIPLQRVLFPGSRLKDLELLELVDPTEPVLDHGPPSTSIRLQVPGYEAKKKQQKHQISLKTYEKDRRPLTRVRLLSAVARAIKQILENLTKETQDFTKVARLFPAWTIGKEDNMIRFEDLHIISLHNVSQGTWQPHLYLKPRPSIHNRSRY